MLTLLFDCQSSERRQMPMRGWFRGVIGWVTEVREKPITASEAVIRQRELKT